MDVYTYINRNGVEEFLTDDIIYSESDEGWAVPCEMVRKDDQGDCDMKRYYANSLYADLQGDCIGLIKNINIDALS